MLNKDKAVKEDYLFIEKLLNNVARETKGLTHAVADMKWYIFNEDDLENFWCKHAATKVM